MLQPVSLFWFRRDLRLNDNAGLFHALKSPYPVLCVFIFDRNILDILPDKKDARVEFIHQHIQSLRAQLQANGSDLLVLYDKPEGAWAYLTSQYHIKAVYTNRDYEPSAIKRDEDVARLLAQKDIAFHTFKDHVIFEQDEILKSDGMPYTVFTPYSRRWLEKLQSKKTNPQSAQPDISFYLAHYPVEKYAHNLLKINNLPALPSLEDMGFTAAEIPFPSSIVNQGLIRQYDKTRDFPAMKGTSRLGVHFRFGTISIREKARHALQLNATYLNELIWRDFYSQILAHFPHVVGQPFRAIYDRIEWRDAPEDFQKWCAGRTGYPIVDAGMRELSTTGYMHNRVRMIVASFLSKHLLIDWRLGEAWFAQKLLDFDLASNSGGWQWAAGCGTDAAPYFRIFNPTEQTKKFDPDYVYIRRWVPEFGTSRYPSPIVEHRFARERCLEVYKRALKE